LVAAFSPVVFFFATGAPSRRRSCHA